LPLHLNPEIITAALGYLLYMALKICTTKVVLNIKVNQSRYRPGVAQRVPGS
jgi:hypothetical protein